MKIKSIETKTIYKSYATDENGHKFGGGFDSVGECEASIASSSLSYLKDKKAGPLVAEIVYNTNAEQPRNKEMIDSYNVIARTATGLADVITLRLYMGRASSSSVVYACLWVHGRNDFYLSGKGKAGGYGYCKSSAAAGNAIKSAGIVLSEDVNGRGMGAVEAALELIAKKAGYSGKLLIVRN